MSEGVRIGGGSGVWGRLSYADTGMGGDTGGAGGMLAGGGARGLYLGSGVSSLYGAGDDSSGIRTPTRSAPGGGERAKPGGKPGAGISGSLDESLIGIDVEEEDDDEDGGFRPPPAGGRKPGGGEKPELSGSGCANEEDSPGCKKSGTAGGIAENESPPEAGISWGGAGTSPIIGPDPGVASGMGSA